MRRSTAISILLASILAVTSVTSDAGPGQRQGGANADRTHQVDRDRTFDRDRTMDREHRQDRARVDEPARDRDRDRVQVPASMRDHEIYGSELMTATERARYRKELGNVNSREERKQFQAQHEEQMRNRALAQGRDLVPPGQGPIYGGEFMSVQERNQYREQLRMLDSDQAREQFQMQHRERINKRAEALGLEVADVD